MASKSPDDGNVRTIHVDDLKVILESAARQGALQALAACGLKPEDREHIVAAIELQKGLKEARKEMWRQVGRWAITAAFFAGMLALAAKLGINLAPGATPK
jgi:hypothetical protein